MFTGIIRAIGQIEAAHRSGDILHYALKLPHNFLYEDLELGASIAVDGVCQTVVKIDGKQIWFDAIGETLHCTTLGAIRVGQQVNIERSAKIGDEIGGHLLSGHVCTTGTICAIDRTAYTFTLTPPWTKYLFLKGFVAIDGASLTLVDVREEGFTVHLIPETLHRTTLGQKKIGDRVNIEIDSLVQAAVETVERLLQT